MKPFKFLIFLICLFAIACKKEAGPNSIADKGILYDTANLGTRINIGKAGYTKEIFWGRNADEIFVRDYAGVTKHYQVDLLTKKVSQIDFWVEGRNYDNSSMVMRGSINNISGYYLYHFNTSTFSFLMKSGAVTDGVDVSGNAVFYSLYDAWAPEMPPCPFNSASCANWSPSERSIHFIDFDSKKIVPFQGKYFLSFSKTGRKTLLAGAPDSVYARDYIYIFDHDKAMVVDSLKTNYVAGQLFKRTVYFDDEIGVVKEFVVDNAGEVAIINAKTRDVIQKFTPSVRIEKEYSVTWSHDGTKLFYFSVKGQNTTGAIGVYDLISKKETVFEIEGHNLSPSPDNKKILYQIGTDWYIKNLQ